MAVNIPKTPLTENQLKIQQMQADIKKLELEDVRSEVLATEPGWLSEGNKYMVSVTPHSFGDEGGAEVAVYRWDQLQSSGTLTKADIVTLRDYLTTLIPEA